MKRVILLFGIMILALASMAQENYLLKEVKVRVPLYNEQNLSKNYGPQSFNELIAMNLMEIQETSRLDFEEGTVIVDFTVHTDGTIDNFIIRNSVTNSTDHFVVGVLKRTSGDWIPGYNNGSAVVMQKRIVVCFNDLTTSSLEEKAISYLNAGIKQVLSSECHSKNIYISQDKREARTQRKLKNALVNFDQASRYTPNEISITFWQAKVYEKLGDNIMLDKKLMEFKNLSGNLNNDAYAINVVLNN
jgi:hypothetical protein